MAHILVVEDDPPMRLLIRRVLEIAGHTITDAEDGAQALHILQTRIQPYALVILDLWMPKMDGFHFLDQVTKKPYAIPVLVLTAHRELCGKAKDYGVDACLIKPFQRKQLIEIVDQLTNAWFDQSTLSPLNPVPAS